MYNVMVVDDSAEIRTGLKLKLNWREYGFDVASEAANGAEALSLLADRRVPIVITDIRMPVMDGLELLQQCALRYPETKTVVLSGYDDFPLVQTAIRKGAKDYLLKPVVKTELASALLKLKRELDDERERMLARIVREEPLPAEAAAMMAAYGMPEWSQGDRSVVFATSELRIPPGRLSGGDAYGASFKEAYRLLAREVVSQWEGRIVAFEDANLSDRIHYIASFAASPEGDGGALLSRFAADLKEKVVRFLRLEVVVGIGHPVLGPAEWKEGLEASLLALSRSRPERVSQTVFEGSGGNEEGPQPALLKQFVLAIGQADEGEALRALEAISEAGRQTSVQAFSMFLIQLCLALDETVREHGLKELDLQRMLWPYINSAWGCEALDRIVGNIRDVSLQAIASLKRHRGRGGAEETIEAIRGYMLTHYAEELSLSAIAERYHYNVAYLSDLFRKLTGCTFSDYLLRIRMEHASRLLLESELKVASIAELTGFSSSAYFSNVFKGYYGVGPNEYRKRSAEPS